MSEENSTDSGILQEEYIPIEVVPPPDPVPPGDGFIFGVVVGPPPPPPAGATARLAAATTRSNEVTTLDVDVFLVGAENGQPTVTQLSNAEIKVYFEYLDRKIRFKNANQKEGIGRVADDAPAASLVLVVTNKDLNTASAGVVNISG
ncbi:MAG: hypothetical protein ACO1SX_15625 [Actinomycetota bacterium]